jgi:hypothetical protein
MIAVTNTATVQKQFSIESDIPYIDLWSHSCVNLDLDSATAELGYKITGANGPKTLPSSFASKHDFLLAMTRICGLISCAHMKEYGIEIINLVSSGDL